MSTQAFLFTKDAFDSVSKSDQKVRAELQIAEIFRVLEVESGMVTIAVDVEELFHRGRASGFIRNLQQTVEVRTRRNHATHSIFLTKSIGSTLFEAINEAEAFVQDKFGRITEADVAKEFKNDIANNQGTENFLFEFKDAFEKDQFLGRCEFRGQTTTTGFDLFSVAVERRDEPSFKLRILSKRRPGSGPFEATGTVLLDHTVKAFEEDEDFAKRWEGAIKDPKAIHRTGLAEEALRRHREMKKIIAQITQLPPPVTDDMISPSVMQDINNMISGNYFNF